jgi:hypothetical protein
LEPYRAPLERLARRRRAFSFFVIATMWRTHHRMFHFIKRGDGRLITLNLAAFLVSPSCPSRGAGGQ